MYFPKNKIRTGLYANDGEFIYLDDSSSFSGYYYSLYNGTFFEGKSPTKGNREIIKIISSENNEVVKFPIRPIDEYGYNGGISSTADSGSFTREARIIPTGQIQIVPTFFYPQPTEQDYSIGQFLRYFCKKVNENIFLEINKSDYDNLAINNPKYIYQLYKPFYLFWYITGKSREETATINKKVALRYEKELQLYGLDKFIESIGGYDKYYK